MPAWILTPPTDATSAFSWAILLAAGGALLFGLAALGQHRAVQRTVADDQRRPAAGRVTRLIEQPAWLLGTLSGLVGGGLHAVALSLAPLAVVQPIGVLAVPVTVVGRSLRSRRWPTVPQLAGVVLSVVAVGGLTGLLVTAAGTTTTTSPTPGELLLTAGGVLAAVVVVARATRALPALARCMAWACSAAVLFGLTSTAVRILGRGLAQGLTWTDPLLLTAALTGGAAALAGVWATQSAYRHGAPPVVVCCLTLIDPLAAVLFGRLLLTEGIAGGPSIALILGLLGAAATIGVILLAKAAPPEVPVAIGGRR